MATLYVSPLDVARSIFCVTDTKGGRFSVSAQDGQCGCARARKTGTCPHLAVVSRYLRKPLPLQPLSICVSCDNAAALRSTCATCGGTGRIPEDLAKGMRLLKWPIRTEAENVALLRLWGEKTERDIPRTRIRFRAADDEAQAA